MRVSCYDNVKSFDCQTHFHHCFLRFRQDDFGIRDISSNTVLRIKDKDELLGVVSSHIGYQLNSETGEQTPEYNLAASEREVITRFLSNKLRINLVTEELPSYMFKEDFNTLNQIEALSKTQVCPQLIYYV